VTLEHDDETARPHAPDTDDLQGEVGEANSLEELPPMARHGGAVVVERCGQQPGQAGISDVLENGWVIDHHAPALDDAGQ